MVISVPVSILIFIGIIPPPILIPSIDIPLSSRYPVTIPSISPAIQSVVVVFVVVVIVGVVGMVRVRVEMSTAG